MKKLENQGLDLTRMAAQATKTAALFKALGHDGRLAILCHLVSGPKSVSELEALLSSKQSVVSQHLARLRLEGLVSVRREGKMMHYSILDPKVQDLLGLLDDLFQGSDPTGT
jgi:DNA-binding transcriptional ArsR family regulator